MLSWKRLFKRFFFMPFTFLTLICSLFFLAAPVMAQELPTVPLPEAIAPIIVPVISSEDTAPAGKTVLFDASESSLLPDSAPSPLFRWTFSDKQAPKTGKEILRSFERTGTYTITLTIHQGDTAVSAEKQIFIYDTRILMVTDEETVQGLSQIAAQAAENGVLLQTVIAARQETEFITEETLVRAIAEQAEFIDAADALLFYSKGALGLRSFTRYWQGISDAARAQRLRGKMYVALTDEALSINEGLAQQAFRVIHPAFILLTRREALNPIFEAKEYTAITPTLENRGIEARIIDERTEQPPYFLLSRLVSRFVAQGVPSNTLYLILAFPFIAFLIAFAREVLGLSAFGIYTPAMIATAFLILGLNFGLITFFVVVVMGWLMRQLINRIDLLYIPRTALVLSSIALSFLAVIWFLIYFKSPVAISLALFPMLVMSTVTEKFLSAQQEEGMRHALWGVARTVIVVVAAYFLVTWNTFANLLTATPEYVLIPLFLLLILGKFTGLRIAEYFRFRSLLREGAEE
jgi:hypothetical protein